MKCPMLTMYAMSFESPEKFKDRDCLKEECEWFSPHFGRCGFLVGVEALDRLERVLTDILAKMPSAGQFLK